MTTDVVVRPDGKISLPVLNEIQAAGLTPEQLRASVTTAAGRFFEEPSVNVVVKQINSRKVSITGEDAKPGLFPLSGRMTVLQLIAAAGGLGEFAKGDAISVIRTEGDKQTQFKFNYKDVVRGKNLKQNIELHIGDVVVVP
jgi:polysaccharide export outer membrane protein